MNLVTSLGISHWRRASLIAPGSYPCSLLFLFASDTALSALRSSGEASMRMLIGNLWTRDLYLYNLLSLGVPIYRYIKLLPGPESKSTKHRQID